MSENITIALITLTGSGVGSLAGIIISNKLTNYRIEQLEKKVEKHNSIVERTYKIEQKCAVYDEQTKVTNHRLTDLENGKWLCVSDNVKKKKFSKLIVVLVIFLNIIFTGAVFVAAFFNATIPDSLIVAWFAFTTTELVALAGIRIKGDWWWNFTKVTTE